MACPITGRDLAQNSVRSWQYSHKTLCPKLLFWILRRNCQLSEKVEAVMLSHGHWDHAGGLTKALDLIVKAKGFHHSNNHDQDHFLSKKGKSLNTSSGESGIPCFLHPGMFRFITITSNSNHQLCSSSFHKIQVLIEESRIYCGSCLDW